MEFKEKIKKLRREKGISQQALANAIFISRSAVAKWENGLGLPSADSCEALAKYFGVSVEYLRSNDDDVVFVEKNQKLHRILSAVLALFLIAGCIFSSLIVYSMFSDRWGLTSELAAGEVWYDNPKFEFSDYDIYYSTMNWTMEGDDRVYQHIAVFKPLRKELIGYSYNDEDYSYRKLYFTTEEGLEKQFGIIYSIKGEDCYYNIITSHASLVPEDFVSYGSIVSNGKTYKVEYNSFFISEERPEDFLTIGNTEIIIYADEYQ